MHLEAQLQAEAEVRAEALASRFRPANCASCGTARDRQLIRTEFRWRKQIGRGVEHHVRVEHFNNHMMCPSCLADLHGRRRWFWMLRYAGGGGLAAALCGVVATPILLYAMRLRDAERWQMIALGIVALILLPVALLALWLARRRSVPAPLRDMTRHGWECVAVRGGPANDKSGKRLPA